MSRKKLLSAGCSLIYGAELSDSPDYHGRDNPSNKTWPALLSQHLDYDYYTAAVCGISNQGIVRYVMDACERLNFDLIVVQWSFIHRYELRFNKKFDHFQEPSPYCNLSPWMTDRFVVPPNWGDLKIKDLKNTLSGYPKEIREAAKFWFNNVDSYDTAVYNYLKCCSDLALYLKWKNIPFIFAGADNFPSEEEIKEMQDGSIDTLYAINKTMPFINFENQGFYYWALNNNFSFGLDHPKDDAHLAAYHLVLEQIPNFFK